MAYDERNQTQFKREFHRKETSFREKVCPRFLTLAGSRNGVTGCVSPFFATGQVTVAPGECLLTVTRADLFKTSFFELARLRGPDLRRRLMVQFRGEGTQRATARGYSCDADHSGRGCRRFRLRRASSGVVLLAQY